jgi:hypothetical protein
MVSQEIMLDRGQDNQYCRYQRIESLLGHHDQCEYEECLKDEHQTSISRILKIS